MPHQVDHGTADEPASAGAPADILVSLPGPRE